MVLHKCSSSIGSIAIADFELGACTGLELNVKTTSAGWKRVLATAIRGMYPMRLMLGWIHIG